MATPRFPSFDSLSACRRPLKPVAPFATGTRLNAWPRRVAVVAYGSQVNYSPLPFIMSNRAAGPNAWMRVDSPRELQLWAGGNSARAFKSNHCCVIESSIFNRPVSC